MDIGLIILIIGFIGSTFLRLIRYLNLPEYFLILTFFAVIWYAWEAKKTADEMRTQNDIRLAPFLYMDTIEEGEEEQRGLYVKNIGKGIALNINFKIVDISDNPVIITAENIHLLEPAITRMIKEKMFATKDPKSYLGVPITKIQLSHTGSAMKLKITINFEDIFGNKYSQEITADKEGIKPQKIIRI